MSILFGPLLASILMGAPAHLDNRAHFVAVAQKMKFFSPTSVLHDRDEWTLLPGDWVANWRQARAVIAAPLLSEGELLRLLKHKDPKVRTLALAALFHRDDPKLLPYLAALRKDTEKTAPALVQTNGFPVFPVPPPPLQDQTVGQVATQFVQWWLPYFNRPQEFDAYWAARKDRTFCARWFLVRLWRINPNILPLDRTRIDRVRALRKELDRLPPIDRDWTLLWLASQFNSSYYAGGLRHLATPEELLRAGERLGPQRLMNLLQGKEISEDPDLGTDSFSRPSRQILSIYVLGRSGKWLRPTDADAVLALENTFPTYTPVCAIAVAELRPTQARQILHDAMSRFAGVDHARANSRAALAASLWRLLGEKERDYLVDWFYSEKVDLSPSSAQTRIFLDGIAGVRAPADRKLVARLIADPRFDKLDYHSLGGLVETVNRWVKTPLLPREELYDPRYWRGQNVQGLIEWRRKLKESVPTWTK